MLKFKWPITAMFAVMCGLASPAPLLVGGIAGIIAELTVVSILVSAILSDREFDYESWMGWLFSQYSVIWDVPMVKVINLIFLRIFCFSLLIGFFIQGWSLWFLFIPGLLYFFSCFGDPGEEPPLGEDGPPIAM